jgi:hypothetical protein
MPGDASSRPSSTPCTSAPRTLTGKVPSAIPCRTHSMKRRGRSGTRRVDTVEELGSVQASARLRRSDARLHRAGDRGVCASGGTDLDAGRAPVAARSTSSAMALDASARPTSTARSSAISGGCSASHAWTIGGTHRSNIRAESSDGPRADIAQQRCREHRVRPSMRERAQDLGRRIARQDLAAPVIERAQRGHEPALQPSAGTAVSTGARHRPQLHELRIAVDQWPRRQREALRRKPHPDAKQDDQVRRPAAIDDRLRAERRPLGHDDASITRGDADPEGMSLKVIRPVFRAP